MNYSFPFAIPIYCPRFFLFLFLFGNSFTTVFGQHYYLQANNFSPLQKPGFVPSYYHKAKNALAVNPVQFPGGMAAAYYIYDGENQEVELRLHTLTETDGECTYAIYQNNSLLGEFTNPATITDYLPQNFKINSVKLAKGDSITVAFKNHSNGKIPEGNGFAYARARWTGLSFLPKNQTKKISLENGRKRFDFTEDGISCSLDENIVLKSMDAAHWAVSTGWKDNWPSEWHFTCPEKIERVGNNILLHGSLQLPKGKMLFRDSFTLYKGSLKVTRRWEWQSTDSLQQVSLAVQFKQEERNNRVVMPSILYHGNPAGKRSGSTPYYDATFGEKLFYEEHRFPMPFINQETSKANLTLHSLPSRVQHAHRKDQWWSMGIEALGNGSVLSMFSGPTASNGMNGVIKAEKEGENVWHPYTDTWLDLPPGAILEKTFYIQVEPPTSRGNGFQAAVAKSLDIFDPFYLSPFPPMKEIVTQKYAYAKTRWIDSLGYNQFDAAFPQGAFVVFGWVGQAAALGYALQHLEVDEPAKNERIQVSLDHLSTATFYEDGFYTWYNVAKKEWGQRIWKKMPETLSQGQGMFNLANAILSAKNNPELQTEKWLAFLRKASDFHANRILDSSWQPTSTNEAFLIAPLCLSFEILGEETYKKAALKAGDHYLKRHGSMIEPYWGGTLDATCEDKEGAFGAFQAYLYLYEMTKEEKYLMAAKHACDLVLSYLFVWDVDFNAGRLNDHAFKTRGWTSVSVQNMHIDVYGAFIAPFVYKLGLLTKNQNLVKTSELMFRSCGQLIDAYGSQGEQVQQTNYSQDPDLSPDPSTYRGGYVEKWTVFWITAHFLNAAALFKEFGMP